MLKLGKLPARKDSVTFKLKNYLASPRLSTTPPESVLRPDFYPEAWEMLGNDNYGDCVWAGAGHETMLWNNEAKKTVSFTDANVLNAYSAVTGFNPNDPNSDQGTDMQQAASYRFKTGLIDKDGNRHKVAAYLALDVADVEQLKRAVYLFSAVGIGIEFPDSAMDQFNAGKPWTVKSGSNVEGGHYVPVVGYDKNYVYVVTWGKVQKMTWGFFKKYNDESIVYLSDDMLTEGQSIIGLDVATLQADLKAI